MTKPSKTNRAQNFIEADEPLPSTNQIIILNINNIQNNIQNNIPFLIIILTFYSTRCNFADQIKPIHQPTNEYKLLISKRKRNIGKFTT